VCEAADKRRGRGNRSSPLRPPVKGEIFFARLDITDGERKGKERGRRPACFYLFAETERNAPRLPFFALRETEEEEEEDPKHLSSGRLRVISEAISLYEVKRALILHPFYRTLGRIESPFSRSTSNPKGSFDGDLLEKEGRGERRLQRLQICGKEKKEGEKNQMASQEGGRLWLKRNFLSMKGSASATFFPCFHIQREGKKRLLSRALAAL